MTDRGLAGRVGLSLVAGLVALLLGEAGVRACVLWAPWPRLSDPARVADPLCEDGYWALRLRRGGALIGRDERDSTLGWVADRRRTDVGRREAGSPQWGLFGDSFMASTTGPGERLPDALRRRVHADTPGAGVSDFSVGGYGLGQIVLRVEREGPDLGAGARLLIGVLTTDLDRTVLGLRTGAKPRFTVVNGVLEATVPAADSGSTGWMVAQPLPQGSWLWRALKRWWGSQRGAASLECRVAEKQQITRLLVRRLADGCVARAQRCVVVLFQRREDLVAETWREPALRDAAQRAGLPILEPMAALGAGDLERFFGADRHPSAWGNAWLAERLIADVTVAPGSALD